MKVNGNVFLNIFDKELTKLLNDEKKIRTYFNKEENDQNWTNTIEDLYELIFKQYNSIYESDRMGLYCYNKDLNISKSKKEWNNIDATIWVETLYQSNNKVSKEDQLKIDCIKKLSKELDLSLKTMDPWNLVVAIEHENDYKLYVEEIKKLLLVNTPLKVVISYSDKVITECDNKTNECNNFKVNQNNYSNFKKMFSIYEKYSPLNLGDEFLVILGLRVTQVKRAKSIVYVAYQIRKEKSGLFFEEEPRVISVAIDEFLDNNYR